MSILPNSFPECQLHGCRIVHKFPPSCPLSAQNPLDVLHTKKDEAFAETHKATCEAGHLFRVFDCCESCISRNINHPTISRLRDMPNAKDGNTHTPDAPAWKGNGIGRHAAPTRPLRGKVLA